MSSRDVGFEDYNDPEIEAACDVLNARQEANG
jgi:hypothetical protein